MSQNLKISETGLKLVKAFEGYRPVDREMITGQRIVGYGHRLYSDDAVTMKKSEAETVLRSDLEPFEDMINTEVHAPLTQSQFDALCSFAFNIGPKAFLQSDTLRALNNGRPLDAANGLDIWRKSEIDGKTYVVDALMRRRTAEKALFLRTERNLTSGREDLPPVEDTTIKGLSTEDALPVFTADDANGIVATAPYAAKMSPARRRDDGPSGALQLSELDIVDDMKSLEPTELTVENDGEPLTLSLAEEVLADADQSDADQADVETDETNDDLDKPSPIAAAATDIVARLDALIEDADTRFEDREGDWPDSLVTADTPDQKTAASAEVEASDLDSETSGKANVIQLNPRTPRPIEMPEDAPSETGGDLPLVETQDDSVRARTDSAAKYIQTGPEEALADTPQKTSGLGIMIPVILGFILLGTAGGAQVRGPEALLGPWGPIMTFTGIVIGAGLILFGIYAALRIKARK